MEFSYRLVGTGWAEARIADDRSHAILTPSYLTDALGDLLAALVMLKRGEKDVSFSWEEEPGEYEWTFRRCDSEVTLRIESFPDQYARVKNAVGSVIFETRQPLGIVIQVVSQAARHLLDELGPDEYARQWVEHQFPLRELRELTAEG
jgi:hypothetical protein